ncbi:hypothetical protein [Methylomagnum sp.]
MKVKNLGTKTLFIFGIMLALGGLSNPSQADQQCSKSSLAGDWRYSEQGTHNSFGAWSEIGSFTLNSSGTGSGVAIITAAQAGLVNLTVPLSSIQIISFNSQNCTGTASFIAGGDTANPRTIALVMTSKSSFEYLSTTGDLTIIGKAQKRGFNN